MKLKKILWIPMIVVVFILLTGWVGYDHLEAHPENPVSYALAEHFAKQYKETHFPDTNYELSPVSYHEKDECYYIFFTSPESPDSNFYLGYDHIGVLKRNNYEALVENKGNIAIRLNNKYKDEVAKTIVSMPESIECKKFYCHGELQWRLTQPEGDSSHIIISNQLELDGTNDLATLGVKAGRIHIRVDLTSAEQAIVQNMAVLLLHVRKTLDKANLPFYMISCTMRYPDGTFSKDLELESFLYENITEENLEALLEAVVSYE